MLKKYAVNILPIFYKVIFRLLRRDLSIHWIEGEKLTKESSDEIQKFRREKLEKKLPYLFSAIHEKALNEYEIDKRSYHLVIKKGPSVVGYTRLIPAPFEFNLVSDEKNSSSDDNNDYLEITRAAVDQTIKGLGEILLISAGVEVFLRTKKKGFIAICRDELLKNFLSYGMTPVKWNISINYRGNHKYILIKGSISSMAIKVLKEKISKTNLTGLAWIKSQH